MIISRIFQGIGNQMFQYAYGYARAFELDTDYKIDTSYYINYSEVEQWGYKYKRDFGLNRFNISASEASKEDTDAIIYPRGKNLLQKITNQYRIHLAPAQHKFLVKEASFEFDPSLLHILDNTYVDGYFTDERYFENVISQIRDQFTLKAQPSQTNKEIMREMLESNSVCMSIRRTNFLNNPLHGTCGEEYYYDAMDEMASRIDSPVFYIFSDDNKWVRDYFRPRHAYVLIQHNFPDFYEDFRLMTSCKHHIIPNSTFSWWAAWLGGDVSKIVIAPVYWLNTNEIDYSGFVPSTWIKLDHKINTKFSGD